MTSPLGILEFQKAIRGGVRPNLFSVTHPWPAANTDLTEPNVAGVAASKGSAVTYMCKSAALPATNVGTVELPFRGRVIKVPGDRTYETWTGTFYMDDAFALRSAYEKWIELTNGVDNLNVDIKKINSDYMTHNIKGQNKVYQLTNNDTCCQYTKEKVHLNDTKLMIDQIDPELLNPFKENPYTHSLQSYVFN